MKKTNLLYLLFFLVLSHFANAKHYSNLYEKLSEVNVQWKVQTDLPKEIFTKAAVLDEKLAIQTHLSYVEQTLRKRATPHLSAQQLANRIACLDELHRYWQKGDFPQNIYLPYRNPVFIDKFDNFCAVGYLVKMTGNEQVSREIAATQNFRYVYEIQHDVLPKWAEQNGFSLAELAWIQPGYPPVDNVKAMNNGVGGTVKDMIAGITGMEEIYVGGNFPSNVSMYYAGFAGYDWIPPAMADGEVNAMAVYNNYPVIAGAFTTVNTMPMSRIALLTPTGTGVTPMGALESTVYDLAYFKSELYAAGDFGLKKWDGSQWISIATVDSSVYKLYAFGNELYLGGNFDMVNGTSLPNIAKYDGSTVQPVGNGLTFTIRAITSFKGQLVVGGDFYEFIPNLPVPAYEGYVWRFVNGQWEKIDYIPFRGARINALENVNDVHLYVGGRLTYSPMMGYWGENLAVISDAGNGFYGCEGKDVLNDAVNSLLYNPTTKRLYVGGAFSSGLNNQNLNGIGYIEDNSVSIEDKDASSFTIYPNPVKDKLYIKSKNQDASKNTAQIMDISGKIIRSIPFKDAQAGINISNLTSGLYILRIGTYQTKFIKE